MQIISGSLHNYVKNMQMQQKWQYKKKTGQFGPEQKASLFAIETPDLTAKRVTSIQSKMRSGKKLTSTEIEFLRKNNPELYKKAVEIAREREEYRRELLRCKDKDEVQALHAQTMQKYIAQLNSHGGEMSAEDISAHVNNLQDEFTLFVSTTNYSDKDWKSEKLQEEKQAERAAAMEAAEQEKQTEQTMPDEAEPPESEPDAPEKPTLPADAGYSQQVEAEIILAEAGLNTAPSLASEPTASSAAPVGGNASAPAPVAENPVDSSAPRRKTGKKPFSIRA